MFNKLAGRQYRALQNIGTWSGEFKKDPTKSALAFLGIFTLIQYVSSLASDVLQKKNVGLICQKPGLPSANLL